MIADLEDMVKYCLGQYGGYRKMVENSNAPPSRLIFYRGKAFPFFTMPSDLSVNADGVSEGQFQHVLDQGRSHCQLLLLESHLKFEPELPAIRSASD